MIIFVHSKENLHQKNEVDAIGHKKITTTTQ